MKNTIKRRLAALAAALAVTAAVVTGGSVVTAERAEAVTYSQWGGCQWMLNQFVCKRWVEYTIWEEWTQGKFDHWEHRVFQTR